MSFHSRSHRRDTSGFIHPLSSEITPRAAYEGRRDLLKLMATGAAGAALAQLRPGRVVRAKQLAAAALAPVVPQCGSWLEHAPYGPRRESLVGAGQRY
jgi:hypothetical protein